ncbi:MAG TPA: VTT domain-containing protein [Chloroflexota bacterium]
MIPGLDLQELIRTVGYVGLFAIVFAESCLLFFLPGDSLLFTAGVLASGVVPDLKLDLTLLIVLLSVAAVTGNSLGYAIGYRIGRRLFSNPNSRLFRPEHLERTHAFYEKHGGKTIILARFVPIVRTFAPVVAGMGSMTYRRFVAFNVVGGVLWVVAMCGGGYLFGTRLPADQVDRYLLPVIAAIVVISLIPAAVHLLQERRSST